MVRKILSAVLLVAIGLTTVVSMCDTEDGVIADEKRKRTAFPDLPKKFRRRLVKQYGDAIEQYFLDRIVMRDQWLALASMFPRQSDNSVYMEGKEGWFFLGNESLKYVDRLVGRDVDTEQQLNNKVSIFCGLRDVAKRHGAEFHIMVGPNKATVYPEYLPKTVIPSPKRYSEPLMTALREKGVDVYDPTELIKANKDKGLLYWRTDTHWNRYGSYLATNGFLKHCGLPELPPCTARQEGTHNGDILNMSGRTYLSVEGGDTYELEWPEDAPKDLCNKKILVLGDSFSAFPMDGIARFYSNTCGRHYGHLGRQGDEPIYVILDRFLKNFSFKPDIILWIQVERFFSDAYFRAPDDVD